MFSVRHYLFSAIVGALFFVPASTVLGRVTIIPYPRPPMPEPPTYPEPPYGYFYRWVPPVYRTVYDRVWVDESTQQVYDWIEVTPGRWERVWTTVIIPAHWESVMRRELVHAGYWELVRIEPPPRPIPIPRPVMWNPPTVGVDGYSQQGGEDLGKFTPLYEWPEKK